MEIDHAYFFFITTRNAEKLKEEKGQGRRFYGVLLPLQLIAIHIISERAESKIKTRKREDATK